MTGLGRRRWTGCRGLASAMFVTLFACSRSGSQLPEGAQVTAPMHQLPSRADVEQMLQGAPPMPSSEPSVLVTEWSLGAGEPHVAHDAFLQQLLQERSHLSASPSLSCAALEWARVFQKHEKLPDDRARRYFIARCGGVTYDAASFVLAGQADPSQTDAQVLAGLSAPLEQTLDQQATERMDVGFAMLRDAQDVIIAVTIAPRRVTLAPLTRVLSAEPHVTVRGKLEQEAPLVMALVNQGEYGVVPCSPDPTSNLPEFSFRCPILQSDEQVFIDLLAQPDNQLLLNQLGTLLLYRDSEASKHYQPAPTGEGAGGSTAQVLLKALNEARQRAGFKPLKLAEQQSQQNAKLAPHFFAGLAANDVEQTNQAALAMLAGFGVGGMIRDASVFGVHNAANRNARAWVQSALERPLGRYILLDPTMHSVAVGTVEQAPGLAAMVTTYRFFDAQNEERLVQTVLETFNAQREALGSPPATLWSGNQQAQAQAAKVAARQTDENAALQQIANALGQATGRQTVAFAIPTTHLESIVFPEELLRGGPPILTIGVQPRQQAGSPWGQYLVLLAIAPGYAQTETAQRVGSSRG